MNLGVSRMSSSVSTGSSPLSADSSGYRFVTLWRLLTFVRSAPRLVDPDPNIVSEPNRPLFQIVSSDVWSMFRPRRPPRQSCTKHLDAMPTSFRNAAPPPHRLTRPCDLRRVFRVDVEGAREAFGPFE